MAQCADAFQSSSSWTSKAKTVAMVVWVLLLNALPTSARRTIGRRQRSASRSSTLDCGPDSFDTGVSCRCNPGFRCVVEGLVGSCLVRGSNSFGWGVRVPSNFAYVPFDCLNAYAAPCKCLAGVSPDLLPDEFAMSASDDDMETDDATEDLDRGLPLSPGGTSGSSDASTDARTSSGVSGSSLRPIEVDEDFVKEHLSVLPSSLRDEIIGSITCPISLSLMSDPVVAADGNTYDRESIIGAFRAKAAGQPIRGLNGDISSRTVTENLNVRRVLAEFERLWKASMTQSDGDANDDGSSST